MSRRDEPDPNKEQRRHSFLQRAFDDEGLNTFVKRPTPLEIGRPVNVVIEGTSEREVIAQ